MTAPRILRVTLTVREWELITRPAPAKRAGSFQILMRKWKARINPKTRELDLFPQDLERARRFAVYCGGGYEDRFQAIVDAADRELRKEARQ